MSDLLKQTWENYTASWREGPADKQQVLFASALSEDCVYRDPLCMASGWQELATYIENFHKQVPGGHFVTRKFSSHHQRSIAHWDMVNGNGQVIGEGFSFGHYNESGKLSSMTGFYDVS
jgi:hypothetical protein